jgi:hypothetical protein
MPWPVQAAKGTRTLDLAVVGEQGRKLGIVVVPATARSGARSKNSSAPSPPALVIRRRPQRVRSRYGRRAGRLPGTGPLSAGLPRRTSKQLIAETRADLDEAGRPARFDYEYDAITANLFMMFARSRLAPSTYRSPYRRGLRSRLEDLADIHFVHAKTIVLVRTISASTAGFTLQAFPLRRRAPDRALRWHYLQNTAAGSIWPSLNSASQRLSASVAVFPTNKSSSTEIAAWEHDRNTNHTKADWQFTTKCSHQT